MANPPSMPPSMADADYETILNAVLETERGRTFLAEHMRRNRQADTQLVLGAIAKLERSLSERPSASGAEQMRLDLVDMANAISRTKAEIAAIRTADEAGRIGFARDELDAIVATTEQATSEILAAVERVQEIAWMLREQGTDPAVCDRLDQQATEAYTACSFQDLTGQRIRRVIDAMHFLEARIDAMIRIRRIEAHAAPQAEAAKEAQLINGPARPGQGLRQAEIDDLIAVDRSNDVGWADAAPASEGARAAARPVAPEPAPPAPARLAVKLREAIEALSPAERMALFS
jgi:chemotaxis protein CheZ